MPRIPYAEEGHEAQGAQAVYEELAGSFGQVPNLVKLVGHSGAATRGLGAVLRTCFEDLSIPIDVREIAYLTAARYNGCRYCRGHHEPLARKAGVGQDEIEALDADGLDAGKLEEAWRAAARFALETTRDVVASDAALDELRKHFEPEGRAPARSGAAAARARRCRRSAPGRRARPPSPR